MKIETNNGEVNIYGISIGKNESLNSINKKLFLKGKITSLLENGEWKTLSFNPNQECKDNMLTLLITTRNDIILFISVYIKSIQKNNIDDYEYLKYILKNLNLSIINNFLWGTVQLLKDYKNNDSYINIKWNDIE